MKNNKYFLNTLLAWLVFAAMAVAMVLKAIQSAAVLPELNIPNMVLLSLVALLLEFYLGRCEKRCFVWVAVLSVLTFALLPLVAGFACQHTFWKLGLIGGAVFTVTTWLFDSIVRRLKTGARANAAPVLSALGLYLAAQCFAGILL